MPGVNLYATRREATRYLSFGSYCVRHPLILTHLFLSSWTAGARDLLRPGRRSVHLWDGVNGSVLPSEGEWTASDEIESESLKL